MFPDMGMGMGMGMGFDMGLGMGMMEGALIQTAMIDGALMGGMMGGGIMGGYGGYGPRQQIIITGNGQTTIIEQGGMMGGGIMGGYGGYGPRQQIIVTGNGQTTIIEQGGYGGRIFGGRRNNRVVYTTPPQQQVYQQPTQMYYQQPYQQQQVYQQQPPQQQPIYQQQPQKKPVYQQQPLKQPVYQQQTPQQQPTYTQPNYQQNTTKQVRYKTQPVSEQIYQQVPKQQLRQRQPISSSQKQLQQPIQYKKTQICQSQVIERQGNNQQYNGKLKKVALYQQIELPHKNIEDVENADIRSQDSGSIAPNMKEDDQYSNDRTNLQKQQAIYSSDFYVLNSNKWQKVELGVLTAQHFLNHSITSINKLKAKHQIPIGNAYSFKITDQLSQDYFFAMTPQAHKEFFLRIIWCKLASMHLNCDLFQEQPVIKGVLLKKSQFLGKWEQRFVTISTYQGLKSHKSMQSSASLHIKNTSQIWTRFQIINGQFLQLKIKHGGFKVEFAIPLTNCFAWLRGFYTLLKVS